MTPPLGLATEAAWVTPPLGLATEAAWVTQPLGLAREAESEKLWWARGEERRRAPTSKLRLRAPKLRFAAGPLQSWGLARRPYRDEKLRRGRARIPLRGRSQQLDRPESLPEDTQGKHRVVGLLGRVLESLPQAHRSPFEQGALSSRRLGGNFVSEGLKGK